ncbi:acyl carrier protein [Streptomyces globisporus]|uniref:acyl carrier protein n=1 Tax=Streptomyces TaxID=1883 RepID=UPI00190A2973|nr:MULTISPECIES: acyl carrier protein [unclassified Streptomyces]MBK3559228.1 acyl carrier protein [Streptomyces sp. MBT56]MBK3606172.1 acyl carrier protein [Streptomyces sp. MBT54]MBK3619639.1 acyl carrier protein [Streptomyces sp. MBT98]
MTSTDIAAEIHEYIVATFLDGEDCADLTHDYDLIANGVIDSLGLVRMVSHIGRLYELPVDDLDFGPADFRSIAAITAFIGANSRALAA